MGCGSSSFSGPLASVAQSVTSTSNVDVQALKQQLRKVKSGEIDSPVDMDGRTVLHVAAMSTAGNLPDVITALLKKGCSVSAVTSSNGWMPLHEACASNNGVVCDTLLKAGSPPNKVGRDGQTPLAVAVMNGGDQAMTTLLNHEVDVTAQDWCAARQALNRSDGGQLYLQELYKACPATKQPDMLAFLEGNMEASSLSAFKSSAGL